MKYTEFIPSAGLAQYIECYWTLAGEAGPAAEPQRILPDGSLELILNFADRFAQHRPGLAPVRQPARFVVGQIDRHMQVAPTGRVDLLAVRFRPSGARPFLRVPLNELTGRVVPLDALLPRVDAASAWLGEAGNAEARVRRLERLLLDQLRASALADEVVNRAAQSILAAGGLVKVSDLARSAGLSNRQIERRFRRAVGLEPKLFAQIIRFQRVFRAVESSGTAWVQVALECGYYDQAHLIREFKRFAGLTPPALFDQSPWLTLQFTRRDHMSDSYKTTG